MKRKLITRRYRLLNERLHADNPIYGTSVKKHFRQIEELCRRYEATRILDYGCGKGWLAQHAAAKWPWAKVVSYDPAVPSCRRDPRMCDVTVCVDVLEHIEPAFLDNVLMHLSRRTKRAAYLSIATVPSGKFLADGRNSHLIVKPIAWWKRRVERYLKIVEARKRARHVTMICEPL